MKTRGSWGIVYVAAVFALVAVGVAFASYSYEKNAKAAQISSAGSGLADWRGVSDVPGGASTGAADTAVSDTVSQDLLANYSALTSQGTFTQDQLNQMFSDLVKKDIHEPAIVPDISLADLTIATTSVPNYMTLLVAILSKSQDVKHYELNIFAAAVQSQQTSGIPELKSDADLYQKIGAAMLLLKVPPQLASQHLEAVKSVGALANAVRNLATWSGDPIQAMIYADSYNKATTYVTNALYDLFTAATALAQKT